MIQHSLGIHCKPVLCSKATDWEMGPFLREAQPHNFCPIIQGEQGLPGFDGDKGEKGEDGPAGEKVWTSQWDRDT